MLDREQPDLFLFGGDNCCGHTHKNDGEAELCDIRLCFDASAGTRCYGDDSTRGCRIFDLSANEPGKILTRMVYKSEFGM